MQKLHLVGMTTDHQGLILSARRGAKSGGFVVSLDEDLLDALDAVRGRLDSERVEAVERRPASDDLVKRESSLSVREVQARIRAGRSIEEVAAQAGVNSDWVARFAIPVLAEQAQVVAAARGATFVKLRAGPSTVPLGEAVYRNVAEKGVGSTGDELDRGWSARQVVDGVWLVLFRYVSRGRRFEAVWEYDEAADVVIARDRLAGQLAFRGPSRTARRSARADGPASATSASRKVIAAKHVARTRMAAAAKRAGARSNAAARKVAREREAATKKAADEREHAAAQRLREQERAAARNAADRQQAAAARAAERARAARVRAAAKEAAKRQRAADVRAAARAEEATAKAMAAEARAANADVRAPSKPKPSAKAPPAKAKPAAKAGLAKIELGAITQTPRRRPAGESAAAVARARRQRQAPAPPLPPLEPDSTVVVPVASVNGDAVRRPVKLRRRAGGDVPAQPAMRAGTARKAVESHADEPASAAGNGSDTPPRRPLRAR